MKLTRFYGAVFAASVLAACILGPDRFSNNKPNKSLEPVVTAAYPKQIFDGRKITGHCVEYVLSEDYNLFYLRDESFNGTLDEVEFWDPKAGYAYPRKIKPDDAEFRKFYDKFNWVTNLSASSQAKIDPKKLRVDYNLMVRYDQKFNFRYRPDQKK